MLGQRLDATHDKIAEIAGRLQGKDARRLAVLAKNMRKIAIRWANLYHNELQIAKTRVAESEESYQAALRTIQEMRKQYEE